MPRSTVFVFFIYLLSYFYFSLSLSFSVFGDFFPLFRVFSCITLHLMYYYYCVYVDGTRKKLRHKRRIQWQPFIDKSFQDAEERAIVVESIEEIEAKRR